MVLALGLFFSLTTTTFFNVGNISQVLRDAAYVGLLSVGMSIVMISGNIDLSGGGIVCFSGCICAKLALAGLPAIICVIGAVIIGTGLGYVNSYFINHRHLTPFVTTLASGFVYTGLGVIFAFRRNGAIVAQAVNNPKFQALGGTVGMFFFITIVWIICVLLAWFFLSNSTQGMHIYACGSNENGAKMSGVRVFRMKALAYMISGAMCGLAAAFVVAYNGTASATLGSSMEFQAIAACVVGGIAMSGGKGHALGAAMGALFMAMLTNGLLKYGIGTDWQYMLQGLLIVAATSFDFAFSVIDQRRMRKNL